LSSRRAQPPHGYVIARSELASHDIATNTHTLPGIYSPPPSLSTSPSNFDSRPFPHSHNTTPRTHGCALRACHEALEGALLLALGVLDGLLLLLVGVVLGRLLGRGLLLLLLLLALSLLLLLLGLLVLLERGEGISWELGWMMGRRRDWRERGRRREEDAHFGGHGVELASLWEGFGDCSLWRIGCLLNLEDTGCG
jgi:hypothetical protein